MSMNLKSITTRLGYQQVTGLSSAKGLTVPNVDVNGFRVGPTMVMITAEAQAIRWRDDGIDPTSTVGMPLAAGVTLQYDGDIGKIRFIEQAGGAIVNASFYA